MGWLERLAKSTSVKLMLLSLVTGLMVGLAALTLIYGLEVTSAFLQGRLMGLVHPEPAGEHVHLPFTFEGASLGLSFVLEGRAWLVVTIPTLAGLISGYLCHRWAPTAEGHGIDSLIKAFHHGGGKIPFPVTVIKGLATCLTVGSGGSGGREGPIALMGGGIASWLARVMKLSVRDQRLLMLAGAAGGIGAVFRAPLGGAVGAIELMYKEDLETEALVSAVVSSVTAYSMMLVVSKWVFGSTHPTIFVLPELSFVPVHLLFYLVLALACAALGKLFVSIFHGMRERVFGRLGVHAALRPAIGGFAIGVIALLVPQTLGTGMGYLQQAIDFDPTAADLLPVIRFCIVLFLLKIVTVSLTIGSGGSGGVFGPCMLIGGLLGFTIGLIIYAIQPQLFPGIEPPPLSAFVILGMAAFFAGVANCPLGALVMASEMTSGYALLAPLMLVSVLAMIISRKDSIYRSQVKDKFHSPAHLGDISFEVLSNIRLRDVYRPAEIHTVPISADLAALREIIGDERFQFPLIVVDKDGCLAGLLTMGTIREAIFDDTLSHLITARDVMTEVVVAETGEDLHQVLIRFTEHGYGRLPVISSDEPNRVLGYIAYQDVMTAYHKEIARLRATE